MAKHTPSVIQLLWKTVRDLEVCPDYQWGHMGSCNCGFLARNITLLPKNDIHSLAMQKPGDWSEQLSDYCPSSGLPMDNIISDMITFGFDTDDLKHLERLSDRTILHSLPIEKRNLAYNAKADVIVYLKAWTTLLEARMLEEISLAQLETAPVEVRKEYNPLVCLPD